MAKEWIHPTVRRGSIWWRAQAIGFTVVMAILVVVLLQDPAIGHVLGASAAVALAILFGFLAEKQVKKLRYEFRCEDDENEDVPHMDT